jgi:hypothetical protein
MMLLIVDSTDPPPCEEFQAYLTGLFMRLVFSLHPCNFLSYVNACSISHTQAPSIVPRHFHVPLVPERPATPGSDFA